MNIELPSDQLLMRHSPPPAPQGGEKWTRREKASFNLIQELNSSQQSPPLGGFRGESGGKTYDTSTCILLQCFTGNHGYSEKTEKNHDAGREVIVAGVKREQNQWATLSTTASHLPIHC